ncbi:hypothetical protein BH23BAC3_BH23BAC3_03950 [soil metagenome]
MNLKYQIKTVAIFCLIIITLNSCNDVNRGETNQNTPERHDLECVLVDNVWKIVDASDGRTTDISVARRDTVVWHAPADRDIFFQFMDEALTGTFTQEVRQGESLTLIIGENSETGDNPYAVFVYDAREYARGDSPPRMFVR